jgi:hypothetical protein
MLKNTTGDGDDLSVLRGLPPNQNDSLYVVGRFLPFESTADPLPISRFSLQLTKAMPLCYSGERR